MNSYWQDKIARLDRIDVPAYVVASLDQRAAHSGDVRRRTAGIASREKWLRVHNSHEWPDYYAPENVEDLRRFFDRYLKGIENGWETTPPVRVSILDPGGRDEVNRPEQEFPLARTQFTPLLPRCPGRRSLARSAPRGVHHPLHRGRGRAGDLFTHRFAEDTELTGYLKQLRLWVEAVGADDMDLFVAVHKLSVTGEPIVMPDGPFAAGGVLRVSHRAVDRIAPRA